MSSNKTHIIGIYVWKIVEWCVYVVDVVDISWGGYKGKYRRDLIERGFNGLKGLTRIKKVHELHGLHKLDGSQERPGIAQKKSTKGFV